MAAPRFLPALVNERQLVVGDGVSRLQLGRFLELGARLVDPVLVQQRHPQHDVGVGVLRPDFESQENWGSPGPVCLGPRRYSRGNGEACRDPVSMPGSDGSNRPLRRVCPGYGAPSPGRTWPADAWAPAATLRGTGPRLRQICPVLSGRRPSRCEGQRRSGRLPPPRDSWRWPRHISPAWRKCCPGCYGPPDNPARFPTTSGTARWPPAICLLRPARWRGPHKRQNCGRSRRPRVGKGLWCRASTTVAVR